jgi:hypothetical protein
MAAKRARPDSDAGGGPAAAAAGAAPAAPSLPSNAALTAAAKASCIDRKTGEWIAYYERKPILLDYWNIGEGEAVYIARNLKTKENFIAKSADEFTSPIKSTVRATPDEIVIETENSIYITSAHLTIRSIK